MDYTSYSVNPFISEHKNSLHQSIDTYYCVLLTWITIKDPFLVKYGITEWKSPPKITFTLRRRVNVSHIKENHVFDADLHKVGR